MIVLIGLFAVVMLMAAVGVVFRNGEKEGICKYGYLEEEERNGDK